jgi:hypothetical protein
VSDDQPAAVLAQPCIKCFNGPKDEFHTPVTSRQRAENGGVEDESAVNPRMSSKRLGQGRVVKIAQVAAKPDKGGGGIKHVLDNTVSACASVVGDGMGDTWGGQITMCA